MNIQLRQAQRSSAKIKMALAGSSGSGKTFSALTLASGLLGDGKMNKIAIIDTENGSADLYSHLGDYNVITLTAPYTPERYTEALNACTQAGMEVVIIDSISQEWDGIGGCLELVESYGGKYQDWAKVTPRHQKFIQAILSAPFHVIATMRKKQDYDMTKDGNGKIKVEKVGLKSITREGMEYEFTTVLNLDMYHNFTTDKDRTGIFTSLPSEKLTIKHGQMIKDWCNSGKKEAVPAVPTPPIVTDIAPKVLETNGDIKRTIKDTSEVLAELLGQPIPKTGKEYQDFIKLNFELELIPENFEKIANGIQEIINKLTLKND